MCPPRDPVGAGARSRHICVRKMVKVPMGRIALIVVLEGATKINSAKEKKRRTVVQLGFMM